MWQTFFIEKIPYLTPKNLSIPFLGRQKISAPYLTPSSTLVPYMTPMLHGYWYGYRIRYVSDMRIRTFPKKHRYGDTARMLIIIYKYHIDIQ